MATMATLDVRSRSLKRSVTAWIPLNHAVFDKLGVTGSSPVPPIAKALQIGAFLLAGAATNVWLAAMAEAPSKRKRASSPRPRAHRSALARTICGRQRPVFAHAAEPEPVLIGAHVWRLGAVSWWLALGEHLVVLGNGVLRNQPFRSSPDGRVVRSPSPSLPRVWARLPLPAPPAIPAVSRRRPR